MRGALGLAVLGVPMAGGASVPTTFTLVATTTEDAQTVTINRLQAANAYEIDWGDGSAPQAVAAGYSGTLTHQYASAGAYNIVIPQAAGYVHIDIRDSKIGMTVTAANPFPSVTDYVYLRDLPGLTWTVSTDTPFPSVTDYVYLRNLSGLTWTVSTDTPFPSVTGSIELIQLPRLTWTVSTDTPFPSVTGSITLHTLPGLTWTVSTDTPFPSVTGSVNLYFLSNLTWTVSADTPFPSVTNSVILVSLPGLTWGSGAAINLHSVGVIIYESSLSQPAVDAVLADLYSVFPARTRGGTIDLLGGGNAAPSGTLQAACPPTTGKEYAYELVNDSCGVSDFHWTSVSIEA